MIRTMKIGILFASTSLLASIGGNSIITKPIGAYGMDSQHKSVTESGTEEIETKWKELVIRKWKELVIRNKILFKRMVQDPNGVSKEDVRKLVDKANDFYNKQFGYGKNAIPLKEAWSKLTWTAEEARRKPHRYRELLNEFDKSINNIIIIEIGGS
ncbi:hypothetical protein [Pasteuria penetrans]|uniref:hypothetical protein n=1 Tax=Pasteuria penetrans TaxID=86005 RepID=UPI000FB05392|nr:hypothetical protein [Pasteuria penetrans]